MDFDPTIDFQKSQAFPHRGMLNLIDTARDFRLRVAYSDRMLEQPGHRVDRNVRIFVDSHSQTLPAVHPEVRGVVGTTTQEADPERRPADDHGCEGPGEPPATSTDPSPNNILSATQHRTCP